MGGGATFRVPWNGSSVFPCRLDYPLASTQDKIILAFLVRSHVSDTLAMNIFSCYNSSKSSFFYPRYRLEALKKGHCRHQLLLLLESTNNLFQFPTAPNISEGDYAPKDEDDDGGADSGDGDGWDWRRVSPAPSLWSAPA